MKKQVNPVGRRSARSRVVRGGSWYNGVNYARPPERGWNDPRFLGNGMGLRIVALKRSAKNEKAP